MTDYLEALKRSLASGRIDRRGFMTGALALGTALSLASSAFAQTEQAIPKKGGTLRVGFLQGSTSDSFDPATYNNDFMFATNYAVFNHLTEFAPGGVIAPDLAESFAPETGAKVWTFKLRKNVEFSDGRKLTSADVIASLGYHLGEDSKSAVKPVLSQIAEMKAPDDHTVVFELTTGNADFPYIFADYHLCIKQAVNGKIDPLSQIGTGGYTVESFEPGVRVRLKRRDNYWKEGRAHFDQVEITTISDTTARMNALMTGQVDFIDRPDLKTIHLLKRAPGLRVETVSGTLHYTMPMHVNTAPFDNVDVRMALKLAIDREELVEKVLKGYGTVGNDHPVSSSMPFFDPSIEQRAYDPDKAKFHLKQAGLSNLSVQLYTAEAAFEGAVDASILYAEQAKKANINIEVLRQPNDGYWSNVWLVKPFCCSYWGGRPTPDWMFSAGYSKDAEWNDTKWNDERFNKLLLEARAEVDQSRRAEMYSEMQRLCRDDGGALIPMFGQYVFAMKDTVQHGQLSEMWNMDSLHFIERWWMA